MAVQQLVAPPGALFTPVMIARVLWLARNPTEPAPLATVAR
jgi:hypothetical protein